PTHLRLPSFPTRRSSDLADQLQREEHHRKRDAVRQLHGYDVAASDADAAEELGASLDLARELSIGDAAAGIGEHLAVGMRAGPLDRKSTRLNSSHQIISY